MDLDQIAALLDALDKIALSVHTPALTVVAAVLAAAAVLLRKLAAAKAAPVAADAAALKPADVVKTALQVVKDEAPAIAPDSEVAKAVADALK